MLTQTRLKELLDYDPETGVFTWKVRRTSNTKIGGAAGSLTRTGYVNICIGSEKHLRAHRLAFLWMTGAWPKDQVDHINRMRSDNRWANLRDASNRENGQNISSNTSGHAGVYYAKHAKKWRALIRIKGKRHHLGYFKHVEDAAAAYVAAVRRVDEW